MSRIPKRDPSRFYAGTLQSIIDNVAIIFDYNFIGTPNSNYQHINPVKFVHGDPIDEINILGPSSNDNGTQMLYKNPEGTDYARDVVNKYVFIGNGGNAGGGGSGGGSSTSSNPYQRIMDAKVSQYPGTRAEIDELAKYDQCWGTWDPSELFAKYGRP